MEKPRGAGFVVGGDLCKSEDDADLELSVSTSRLRAICEQAPSTLPEINLDLSADEESELGVHALAALQRLKALWGAHSA
jgi:hypothetical protein